MTRLLAITGTDTPDLKMLRDITGVEGLPRSPEGPSVWLWLIAPALLALGGGVLLWLWRRHAQRLKAEPAFLALRALDRLRGLRLPEKGHAGRFITLLANLVRGQVEKGFQLPARKQTTPEFLEQVVSSPDLTGEQKEFLSNFLPRCDLAKFAGVLPTVEECYALADQARVFLKEISSRGQEGKNIVSDKTISSYPG